MRTYTIGGEILKALITLLILGSIWYTAKGQDLPKVSDVDILTVQVKIQELQIKDLQARLSSQMIVSTELRLENLRREQQSLSSEFRDLSTYLSSYLVALVARYKLNPDQWVYDMDKKAFIPKPKEPAPTR